MLTGRLQSAGERKCQDIRIPCMSRTPSLLTRPITIHVKVRSPLCIDQYDGLCASVLCIQYNFCDAAKKCRVILERVTERARNPIEQHHKTIPAGRRFVGIKHPLYQRESPGDVRCERQTRASSDSDDGAVRSNLKRSCVEQRCDLSHRANSAIDILQSHLGPI